MNAFDNRAERNTSPYFDYFQTMFQAADVYSGLWQPLLKGLGRSQLEFATLQARHGQALMQWGRQVAVPSGPFAVMEANLRYWDAVSRQFADFAPKLASAVNQATQPPAAFEVLAMPAKAKSHDTLVMIDLQRAEQARDAALQRDAA
jgi:hypothetical protein